MAQNLPAYSAKSLNYYLNTFCGNADNSSNIWENFTYFARMIRNEYENKLTSGFTSLTLYKVAYAPETLRIIDSLVYVYILGEISKKGSTINDKSIDNILEYLNSEQRDNICKAIITNTLELYNHYFGTNEEKTTNGIKITFNNLKEKFSSSSRKTKDDVDRDVKKYEEEQRRKIDNEIAQYENTRRAEIDREIRNYRASEEQKIKDSLERTEKIDRAAAKTKIDNYEKDEKARIAKELAEKAKADRKAIDEVKQQVIAALRENAYDAERKEKEDEYNRKVEKMPEDRQKFNNDMSEQLRVLSSDFRTSTGKVSDDITDLVSDMAEKLNKEVKSVKDSLDDKISAVIAELNASTSGIMTSLNTSTETAVNSTVNIERALKNDDFNDLLEAYCRLDNQTYYRRQKGTDSEEYKSYWKSVEAYLRGFKNTLSKFGYEVYSPSVGYSPESVDDVNFDDRECEEYPETNEECKDFIIAAIVNSGIRHKENNGEYYIDQRPRIVVKRKDENNDNGDEKR